MKIVQSGFRLNRSTNTSSSVTNSIAKALNNTEENMECCDSVCLIKDGWFREINELWHGHYFALKVDSVLSCEKSVYQDIMVLKTTNHGNALILDGIIQCTENDEFAYQEMIAFLPLCAHPNPEKVLIVGGGDGGVTREVDKHPLVKRIVQVEIDQTVIDVSKKYLPNMAKGFDSPKLELKVCDGFEYMKCHKNEFDVIITDSSDPIGPATALFSESYFALLKGALRSGGIICSQGGTLWDDIETVKNTLDHCRKHFKEVRYPIASVPTYPTGQIGFFMGALDGNSELTTPKFKLTEEDLEKYELKYYNTQIHSVCDGFEYMKCHKNEFDVIITDSSDPIGPATALFSESYFALLKGALRSGGIICSQGGTLWDDIETVKNTLDHCRKHFKEVRYPIASVPTYPTGQIGFFMGALDGNSELTTPKFKLTEEDLEKYELKYYNTQIHSASFVLPNFARKALYE